MQANVCAPSSGDAAQTLASPLSVAEQSDTVRPAVTSMEDRAPNSRTLPSVSNDSSDPTSVTIDKAGLHTSLEDGSPENRWDQAVSLTREAMVAWMNVLAGPALVKVSAQ